jgi:hypothetical protein
MKGPITYREVTFEQDLQAYEELIDAYWGLPEQSHPYVFRLSRWIHASGDRATSHLECKFVTLYNSISNLSR